MLPVWVWVVAAGEYLAGAAEADGQLECTRMEVDASEVKLLEVRVGDASLFLGRSLLRRASLCCALACGARKGPKPDFGRFLPAAEASPTKPTLGIALNF